MKSDTAPRVTTRLVCEGLMLLAAFLAGCASAPSAPSGLFSAECVLPADPVDAVMPGSVTVAIHEPADPAHAPVPHHNSERLVFAQLYETLVNVDCLGRVVSGLAQQWSAQDGGRVWRFRLRPDAWFWDGSRVDAQVVAESLGGAVAAGRIAPFVAITIAGQYELTVELSSAQPDARIFAHPGYAVVRRVADAAWPLGTGLFRPDSATAPGDLRLVAARPDARALPTLDFRMRTDARRALDEGADLVVTADAAVLEYARALPAYLVSALAWSQTYVLVSPHLIEAAPVPLPLDGQQALRAGVRAETRPAATRDAQSTLSCDTLSPATSALASPAQVVVYPRNDAVARDLAERLVALAWPTARTPEWLRTRLPSDYARMGAPAARGLDPAALLNTLRNHGALAAIVPVPVQHLVDCRVAGHDVSRVLQSGSYHVTPLLDVRDQLVHRRVITIRRGADGILHLDPGA